MLFWELAKVKDPSTDWGRGEKGEEENCNNPELIYFFIYSKTFHSSSIIIKSVFLTQHGLTLHFNREIYFF